MIAIAAESIDVDAAFLKESLVADDNLLACGRADQAFARHVAEMIGIDHVQ
jgi:hypothetical protein